MPTVFHCKSRSPPSESKGVGLTDTSPPSGFCLSDMEVRSNGKEESGQEEGSEKESHKEESREEDEEESGKKENRQEKGDQEEEIGTWS